MVEFLLAVSANWTVQCLYMFNFCFILWSMFFQDEHKTSYTNSMTPNNTEKAKKIETIEIGRKCELMNQNGYQRKRRTSARIRNIITRKTTENNKFAINLEENSCLKYSLYVVFYWHGDKSKPTRFSLSKQTYLRCVLHSYRERQVFIRGYREGSLAQGPRLCLDSV